MKIKWIQRVLDRITRPTDPAHDRIYVPMMNAGMVVNHDTALQFAAVYRAVSYISGQIALMPWRVMPESNGSKEIVANSVVIIVFMQVGYAVRSESMLRADFLVVMMPMPVQKILLICAYLLGAALFLFLLKAGVTPALRSFANGEFDGEGALKVAVWPARFAILVGAALAGLNYILLALVEIFGLRIERMDLH